MLAPVYLPMPFWVTEHVICLLELSLWMIVNVSSLTCLTPTKSPNGSGWVSSVADSGSGRALIGYSTSMRGSSSRNEAPGVYT